MSVVYYIFGVDSLDVVCLVHDLGSPLLFLADETIYCDFKNFCIARCHYHLMLFKMRF